MKISRQVSLRILLSVIVFAMARMSAFAQSAPAPVKPVANPCPRFAAGGTVHNPPALFSDDGVLTVNFSYQTVQDAAGRNLFCFMTPNGTENPTLHVNPGDQLVVNVTNNTPAPVPASAMKMNTNASTVCGAATQDASSLNIHYHGTNTSPTCHADEVIHTLINAGQSFQYVLNFPANEPPGLYWYHPHVHGLAEQALLGGASGALIVNGIERIQPAVAGLRHRVLVVRDQNVAGNPTPGGAVPSWDLTLNNIPIAFPALTPANIHMRAGETQFWRVSNSCSDSILDLQVVFDGVPQTIQIVGLDAVPTGSQDGTRQGKLVAATHVLIPTAGRVEFLVKAPSSTVKSATFQTLAINTGPNGDNDTARTLANIQARTDGDNDGDGANDDAIPSYVQPAYVQRFEGIANARANTKRLLYFSEDPVNQLFFITVDGATPTVFSAGNPPAIVTTQGSIEDWTIQNRAQENHEFHFHQIHFLVLSENNFESNGTPSNTQEIGQFRDMIQVPFWDNVKNPNGPFPSVTVRMDFTGPDVGDFVYHCHILNHEDQGMMAIIRVLPSSARKSNSSTKGGDAVPASTKTVAPAPVTTKTGGGGL